MVIIKQKRNLTNVHIPEKETEWLKNGYSGDMKLVHKILESS